MTNTTLAFQPEAERYYADGYWREGDLWGDFDARARAHADRVALVLEDRRVTYAELRRAAISLSGRLADLGVAPGDVVILLGRHSIEAAVAMLGCLHRGVVLAPLPPMFNQTQMAALVEQTRRQGHRQLRRREGDRQVPRGRGRPAAAADRPPRRSRRGAQRGAHGAPRGRGRPGAALLGHDVGAQGRRALVQHAALRDRGRLLALGPDRRGHLPHRRGVRVRRRARVRLPARAAPGRDRRPAQPLGAAGGAAADRGAPLHLRAGDADACDRHDARRRARPTAT